MEASLVQVQALGARMFNAAGLTIAWRPWKNCPPDGIRVGVSQYSQEFDHPQALAYAMPYEGSPIVLFWDRIASAAEPQTLPFLLAHVLVHEVTHILQGLPHHSSSGIMKAKFGKTDIAEMRRHPLPFTDDDVELIHLGMKHRQTRLARVSRARHPYPALPRRPCCIKLKLSDEPTRRPVSLRGFYVFLKHG